MELLKKLFHGKGYIDGITIINLEGEILFTAKLNGKLSNEENACQLVGKRFLDIYENLDSESSTMLKAMELGMPLYVENQLLKTKSREEIRITSLSLPIKSRGRIVGAIDLSMEVRQEELSDTLDSIDLKDLVFPLDGSKRLDRQNAAVFTEQDIIAVDEKMKQARDYIKVVAACDLPVMIYGETGTGKEVFAQSIHNAGDRRDKPFIARTVRRSRKHFWRVFYSEPLRGPLRALWRIKGYLNWQTAERCSWTRLIPCPCRCSQSFSAFSRTGALEAWAPE